METSNETRSLLCILCLKLIDNSIGDSDNDNNCKRFFKVIIRHLFNNSALISADNQEWCINAFKVISETTISSDDIEPFFENVKICNNCEGITRKFSHLYHQMKELELRIDWEVLKLWNLMGRADTTVSRLKKDELKNMSTFDGGGVTLGEFRHTLKQSCKTYHEIKKISVPYVKLAHNVVGEETPLHGRNDDVELPINSECTSIISAEYPIVPPKVNGYPTQPEVDNPNEPSPERMEKPDKEQNMDVVFPAYPVVVNCGNDLLPLSLPSLPLEPQSALISQEEDPLNPPNSSQFTYICTTLTCSLPFTSKFELFQHNMANHVEKYFLSVQQSELPNDQFNHYITHLLETILDTFDKVDQNYECPICSNLLSGWEKARNHLVVKHRPILKEKLVKLQKSESALPQNIESMSSFSTLNITNTTLKRKRGRPKGNFKAKRLNKSPQTTNYDHNRIACNNCEKTFNADFELKHHQKCNHPEIFFEDVKPTGWQLDSEGSQLFKKYVGFILERQVDQEFTKITVTVATLTESGPTEKPQEAFVHVEGSGKVIKFECNFCSSFLYSRRDSITHLVLKHQQKMAEIMKVLLRGKSLEEIKLEMMQMHFEIESPEIAGPRRGVKIILECLLCSAYFKNKLSLFQHGMSHHIEKYFSSAKLEDVSNEQFKKCVVVTIEDCIRDFEKVNAKFKCSFCTEQLSGIQNARYHLVMKHRPILKDKLVEVQKSGSCIQNEESAISLKRKRGRPKGKSQSLKNRSLYLNLSGNPLKTERKSERQKWKRGIDNVSSFRRDRKKGFSRCAGCGKIC